jgi:hypothetical protein
VARADGDWFACHLDCGLHGFQVEVPARLNLLADRAPDRVMVDEELIRMRVCDVGGEYLPKLF